MTVEMPRLARNHTTDSMSRRTAANGTRLREQPRSAPSPPKGRQPCDSLQSLRTAGIVRKCGKTRQGIGNHATTRRRRRSSDVPRRTARACRMRSSSPYLPPSLVLVEDYAHLTHTQIFFCLC